MEDSSFPSQCLKIIMNIHAQKIFSGASIESNSVILGE